VLQILPLSPHLIRTKVKLSLCLIKFHPMKMYGEINLSLIRHSNHGGK
jgi:hypothetical protein